MLTLPELFVSLNSSGLQLVTINGALSLSGGPVDAAVARALDHHRGTLQTLMAPEVTPAPTKTSVNLKPSRCTCDKGYRQVTTELSEPGWYKITCTNCNQWVGLRPAPRACPCPADKWEDMGADSRGYIRIECSECGQFKGYRPPPPAPKQKGLRLTVLGQKPREKVVRAQPGLFEPLTAQSFYLLPEEEREADEITLGGQE